MRYFFTTLLSTTLLLIFLTPSHAATYLWQLAGPNKIDYPKTCTHFVDGVGGKGSNGDNSNNGKSIQSAWLTPQYAAKTAPSGSVICFRGGSYILGPDEIIRLKKGGQRFTNYQSESPLIKGKTPDLASTGLGKSYKGAFSIESPNNIIENFQVRDRIGVGIAIKNNDDLSKNIVRNNLVHNISTIGININADESKNPNSTYGIKIQYNDIQFCAIDPVTKKVTFGQSHGSTGQVGVDCSLLQTSGIRSSTQSEDKALIIEGNHLKFHQNHGFMGDANTGMSRGMIIRNNLFAGARAYLHLVDDVIWDSNFHYFFRGSNNLGTKNRFGFTSGEVDDLTILSKQYSKEDLKSKNVYITNNFLYGDQITFRLKIEDDLGQLENVFFKGNTVITSNEGSALELLAGRAEFYHAKKDATYVGDVTYNQAFTGLTLEDNIFYKTSATSQLLKGTSNFPKEKQPQNHPPTGPTWRNNIWSHQPTLNATGFDKDKITKPQFVANLNQGELMTPTADTDPVKLLNQLKLLSSSPAINAATNNDLDHDFFGSKRPFESKSDIGAHEFGGTPTTPNPTQEPSEWDLNDDGGVDLFDLSWLYKGYSSDYSFTSLIDFTSSI